MKNLDFLAVGDITTDAFIRLTDAHVHCKVDTDACELCVRFADKIPYESLTEVHAVGNSPNAAVCAARLGLSAGLVSNLGDDTHGFACLETLKKEGIDAKLVTAHKNTKTNYHFVLWYGAERTILVKHEAYPYALPDFAPPRWLYLSSVGAGMEQYHESIAQYLAKHPETKFAFQPGTFQIPARLDDASRSGGSLDAGIAHALYARAEVLVVNREEAKKITSSVPTKSVGTPPSREESAYSLLEEGTEQSEAGDVKTLLSALRALGPKLVCITDGPAGAYFSDGVNNYFMPPYPDPKPPLERTGAGDAFAATFVSYLALGKTPLEALRAAPINSAYVVQDIGAQRGLLSREALETCLTNAPRAYIPRKI